MQLEVPGGRGLQPLRRSVAHPSAVSTATGRDCQFAIAPVPKGLGLRADLTGRPGRRKAPALLANLVNDADVLAARPNSSAKFQRLHFEPGVVGRHVAVVDGR